MAIAGNPNAGKTTLFNALTGAHQRVGNWPGVTVERKVGYATFGEVEAEIVDLPGTYSLKAYGDDERVARDFLLREDPDLVLVVVDASNLERNLYLATQLIELRLPVLVVLNMMDVARQGGIEVDRLELAKVLGVPVVETVGNRRHGSESLTTLLTELLADAEGIPSPARPPIPYDLSIREAVEALTVELREEPAPFRIERLPGVLLGLLTRDMDPGVLAGWPSLETAEARLAHLAPAIRKKERTDLGSHIYVTRYSWLKGLVAECTRRTMSDEARSSLTDRIDRVLTNRVAGIPLFLAAIWLVFQLVFTVGNPFAAVVDAGFSWIAESTSRLLLAVEAPTWLVSLLAEGIISGVGSVMVFLPNILILFFFIALMEDSGYMARAAFVMDRVMHVFGLHGKSFIPLFMGFGCNIPAIMAARTLENRKDRLLTIMALPFVSCSARLTVFVLLTGIFFKENQGLVLFTLYFAGVMTGMIISRILKNLLFREEVAPLIMELPQYKLPRVDWIFREMTYRAKVFVRKAGTVILLGSVVLWAAASMPFGVAYGSQESWIGIIGASVAPILEPAGLGVWQIVVALLVGIVAKEMVVSTLATLYGVSVVALQTTLGSTLTPASSLALMVMVLLYVPCLSTVVMIRRESGSWWWAALSVALGFGLGYVLSVVVYLVGTALL